MAVTLLMFFVVLALLVLSHEFGHFLLAKWSGVKVEEFGFGFPPRIFSITRGETVYSFNLLPLGGFVKLEGEDADGAVSGPRSFAAQNVTTRAMILSAGVLFNFLLAFVLLSGVFMAGSPVALEDGESLEGVTGPVRVAVLDVRKNSAAEVAGLLEGDFLLELRRDADTITVANIADVQDFIARHKGEEISITFERAGKTGIVSATPALQVADGEGALGIAMARIGIRSYPWHEAIIAGARATFDLTAAIIAGITGFFVSMVAGNGDFGQVAGPVGIVGMVGSAMSFGLMYLLHFTAVLSINLAVINFIPFPGLDGGRLLFLGLEAVKGAPVNPRFAAMTHLAGFMLLLILMAVITFYDVAKLF